MHIKILSLILFTFFSILSGEESFTEFSGDYFGETPPGETPKILAHNLLANSINISFSPDGKEFFFVKDMDSNNTGDIHWMKRINDRWMKPIAAPFNSLYIDNDICLSNNGKKAYFRSWRPIDGMTEEESSSHIWYSQKINDKWSDPHLVKYVDGFLRAGYPSISKNGKLYFPKKTNRINNYGELFYLELENGKDFTEKIALYNDPLNEYNEGDMCVSPDESFVITSCWQRPDTSSGGESDLYISFNLGNGEWSRLINMGKEINSDLIENCPTISHDSKYFFFNRYDGKNCDAYWVSTSIIKKLRELL